MLGLVVAISAFGLLRTIVDAWYAGVEGSSSTRLVVRSNISLTFTLPLDRATELKGIAFDGGSGIKSVDVSIDEGRTWRRASLGEDLGRYSFREWRIPITFARKGNAVLMCRATANNGDVQPMTADWNPAGYRRNVVEQTPVSVV